MKRLAFLFVVMFFLFNSSFAQQDTALPITVTIKVEKEYEVKLPKAYFSYEIKRGIYNITTDSVNEKRYDMEIVLKNNASEPIFLWLMTCS